MAEFLVSILFVYPGALIEVINRSVFGQEYEDDHLSDAGRIAWYFVSSAIVSLCSLLVFAMLSGQSVANLTAICASLSKTMELFKFIVISLLMTVVFAFLFQGVKVLGLSIKSVYTEHKEGARVSDIANAWRDIYNGDHFAEIRKHMIFRITNNGHSKAGFVKHYFNDFEKGIILTQTDTVEAFLAYEQEEKLAPDKMWIGSPEYTFFEPESGTFIEMFNGSELSEHLDEEVKKAKEKAGEVISEKVETEKPETPSPAA